MIERISVTGRMWMTEKMQAAQKIQSKERI
jgi:hypothetical protein